MVYRNKGIYHGSRMYTIGEAAVSQLINGLVRLTGGWWLRLIYCERKILLAG
jgi:hypothetical protein